MVKEEPSSRRVKPRQASGNGHLLALFAFGFFAVLLSCSHTLTSSFVPSLKGRFSEKTTAAALTNSSSEHQAFELAHQDSYGFFDDVPDDKWLIRKRIANERIRITLPIPQTIKKAQPYYQNNWNPEFSCEFEDFVGPGGDGGKWICDPHRLLKTSCTVYSIGSNGKFDFEEHLLLALPHCEVHIFDFTDYTQLLNTWGGKGVNASFHAWGLKGNDGTVNDKARSAKNLKSMKETVEALGHVGRRIDIFKIDCEGCEWNSYKDWFDDSGVTGLHQILVETHNIPNMFATEFFDYLHNRGYALFHKEPNIQYGGGSCVEFSYIQLNPSFFSGVKPFSDAKQE